MVKNFNLKYITVSKKFIIIIMFIIYYNLLDL